MLFYATGRDWAIDALKLDYFRAHESEQYTFFRIPKLLISDERYKPISSDAKILYGLMLDRMGLSIKKGWLDDQGRVFIIYPQDKACQDLNRSINTSTVLFKELAAIGLIVRKWQGQGKPDMIYVMNFASGMGGESRTTKPVNPESQNLGIQNHNICDSRITGFGNQESQGLGIQNPNNCDSYIMYSNTEKNKTEIIKTPPPEFPAELRADDEKEKRYPQIDRDELIRLSGSVASPRHAAILADEVLEVCQLLRQDKDERTLRLLQTADTATLAGFVSEVVQMDLSRVVNLTAYLKRVLADYLRKNSLRGMKPASQKRDASYDIEEIEAWLNRGGDLFPCNDDDITGGG